MNEELEVLKIVAKYLEEKGIAYMLTGSVAMNFYAIPRMTRDIDIVIEISEKQASPLAQLLENEFYVDEEMIKGAIRKQGMFNIIHNEYVIKIDFVIRKQSDYRRTEFERRRKIQIQSTLLWIVSPEDLILSKLFWAKESHSEQQILDIKNILKQVANIDKVYLEKWVENLKLSKFYKEIIDE